MCVYDPAVTDEFLQEITKRCEAGKVTENYFRKMRQITKRLNEFYLTGTLRMDVTLHGTKYALSSNERLVDLFIADMRTKYSRGIIEMLHGAYDTRLRIFNSIIPLSIRAAETNAEGRSTYLHDPASKVSVTHAALTREVLV